MANTRTQHKYIVTLHWHDKVEKLTGWGNSRGEAAADAMNSAGYGGGAIGALKSWDAEIDTQPESVLSPKEANDDGL